MCLFEGSNKFALLWGEAQLCLPYVFIERKVMTYSDPIVTYSHPKVTHCLGLRRGRGKVMFAMVVIEDWKLNKFT